MHRKGLHNNQIDVRSLVPNFESRGLWRRVKEYFGLFPKGATA